MGPGIGPRRPGPILPHSPSTVMASAAAGVMEMINLLFVVKVLAHCVVIACPGGLVLVGIYHWHRHRRRTKKGPRQATDGVSP